MAPVQAQWLSVGVGANFSSTNGADGELMLATKSDDKKERLKRVKQKKLAKQKKLKRAKAKLNDLETKDRPAAKRDYAKMKAGLKSGYQKKRDTRRAEFDKKIKRANPSKVKGHTDAYKRDIAAIDAAEQADLDAVSTEERTSLGNIDQRIANLRADVNEAEVEIAQLEKEEKRLEGRRVTFSEDTKKS